MHNHLKYYNAFVAFLVRDDSEIEILLINNGHSSWFPEICIAIAAIVLHIVSCYDKLAAYQSWTDM